ncbi:GyrI-like domain-containing protein [Caldalkalibacillus mannanilyticus]|uniref:GyrI-like domain-containing protein n=1 Tax=Caldalkalibacillus mannanilyticus TaxID=1418 RepID=UPI00046AA645|nr:GyrI-like domain-containing protein [Caldalkalibacillus mannanilyticus]
MKIIDKEDLRLVGVHLQCENLSEYQIEIPKAQQNLQSLMNKIEHIISPTIFYGVHKADADETEDGYWKCVAVERYENIPEGLVTLTIPQGRYSVLLHTGSAKDIHHTYNHLHKQIEEAGLEIEMSRWTIEEYNFNQPTDHNINMKVQIHEPIKY